MTMISLAIFGPARRLMGTIVATTCFVFDSVTGTVQFTAVILPPCQICSGLDNFDIGQDQPPSGPLTNCQSSIWL
ncbi:hypothetical protein VTJ04DRAFT_2050 [Mycothermus thermophilus]|uniref:uncharacterized protein n=1 Tax=Humicola insolens TaxID=85995 RepID=UPI003743CC8E